MHFFYVDTPSGCAACCVRAMKVLFVLIFLKFVEDVPVKAPELETSPGSEETGR